jgi:hypothetical protein
VRWSFVSVGICRQKALEDALLHSGQFKEALQALLDWLYKEEPQLAEDQLVHGDPDTVTGLIEKHKVLHSKCKFCQMFVLLEGHSLLTLQKLYKFFHLSFLNFTTAVVAVFLFLFFILLNWKSRISFYL